MKSKKTIVIFVIMLVFTTSSCTLTKRHYFSGYHVDWHLSKAESSFFPQQLKSKDRIVQQGEEKVAPIIDEPVLIASADLPMDIQKNNFDDKKTNYKSLITEIPQLKKASKVDIKQLSEKSLPKKKSNEPVLNWIAGAALGLGILGFIFPFFPSVTAIILGIVALKRINSEPEKYKGKVMAIAGIVLGVLGIIFIVGLAFLMLLSLG